ncbi:hypothetical protein TRE132_36930 [Pseudomonas chlororaphis subsp. aurantiaca]|nr:hypothetical protein TRE132_36930 [Pseudomonas chlororaphis subsp. aurantiaca]
MESYSPVTHNEPGQANPLHLLCISARERSALNAYAARLMDFLAGSDELALADICYSLNTGRRQFEERIAVSGKNREELIQALQRSLAGKRAGTRNDNRSPQIGWVMGRLAPQSRIQYRMLFESSPAFQQASREFLETVTRPLGRNLATCLWDGPVTRQDQDLVDGALLYGFAMMWRSLGVEPRWIAAQGPMRSVAAAIVGALSLKQASSAIDSRNSEEPALASLYRNTSEPDRQVLQNLTPDALEQALSGDAVSTVIAMGDPSILGEYLTLNLGISLVQIPMGAESNAWTTIGKTLAALYEAGASNIAEAWDRRPQRRRLPLPTYAFQGRRYWLEQLDRRNDEQPRASTQQRDTLSMLADPASMSVREYVQYLIRQLAKMEEQPLAEDSLLIDDLGFDSLMLAELRTRVEKAYPGVGKVPLDLLHTGRLSELLDYVEEYAGKVLAHPQTTDNSNGRDLALAWLSQWQASGPGGEVQRMNKRHVHKANERNVLLGDIATIEDTGWYAAELFHDRTHPFFYEHAQDHIPGLYLIEAARQFGIACTHLFQGVPHDFPFVLDDMRIQFDTFAEQDSPVYLIAEYTDLMFRDGHLHRSHSRCHIVQNGSVLGTIEGHGLILPPADYQATRSLETTL